MVMVQKRINLSYPKFTRGDISSIKSELLNINKQARSKQNIVEAFENKIATFHDVSHVVALSSGTAAIHLALIALKIKEGDKVIVPTLTFAATAFPISYLGALPVFIDVDKDTWTLDLELLTRYLSSCKKTELPKLIISVDLFGKTCDYVKLFEIANNFNIPVLIDAAESLGSKYLDSYSASLGSISILSFNFNKIITTTGGGALLTNQMKLAEIARKLSNQSRDNYHWYEHSQIGYNYRLSPVLSSLGISQFDRLENIIRKKRKIREIYSSELDNINGVEVSSDSKWERSNAWLSTVKFDKSRFLGARDKVRDNLEKANIESRFVWKPLHMQPVFRNLQSILTGVSEEIFNTSLCLPSSHILDKNEILKVCNIVKESLK